METSNDAVGYILLTNVTGLRLNHGGCLNRLFRYSSTSDEYISRGELITAKEKPSSDYQLYHDPSISLSCKLDGIAPLNRQEFEILEAINSPVDVMSVYNLLDWGVSLKPGSIVYVKIFADDHTEPEHARAIIRYKGEVKDHQGTVFGVELLDDNYRSGHYGTTDGTYNDQRYFECSDGCGLFVSFDRISSSAPQATEVAGILPKQCSSLAPASWPCPAKHDLEVGSLVQLEIPSRKAKNCTKYGVIKWIGYVSDIEELIAGIEMDDSVKGGTDGAYASTNERHFSCPPGRGWYHPFAQLMPDERYIMETSTDGNPLSDVITEHAIEETIIDTNIEKYIGERKGIQGHFNSCYLDATVFGLFALSNDFDKIFLQKFTDLTGQILWKHIINPLRLHGIVRYESVMKLRERLQHLEQLNGITQDEKDPEEFLNVLFKHSLQIPPFISIKRPYGIEKEFFIQLFLEMDESMLLPSVGDLLNKMFREQQISFTEIPSKLLILVPRFGRHFKTFQKILPSKTLNISKNVDSQSSRLCYICKASDAVWTCRTSTTDFGEDSRFFCDICCERMHNEASRSNHRIEWRKEIGNLDSLELLSVICIETSHYVCFTRQGNRWIFFDSMASRVYDEYNIPKVVDCSSELNEWVYPENGDPSRILETSPSELPELVRRFTQDIYMCIYSQPETQNYNYIR